MIVDMTDRLTLRAEMVIYLNSNDRPTDPEGKNGNLFKLEWPTDSEGKNDNLFKFEWMTDRPWGKKW